MKSLMISGFVAVAILAIATTMLWSHSPSADRAVASAGTMSIQKLHAATDVNKLPTEEFEDQSMIFSRPRQ